MSRVIRITLAAAAISLLAGVGAASAAPLYQVNPSTPFGDNGSAVVRIKYTSQNYEDTVRAGGFDVSTTKPATAASSFVAWCLDIMHDLSLPSNYNVTEEPFSKTTGEIAGFRLDNILKLFNTAYAALDLSSSIQSAGFQLALWELMYEKESTTYSLKDGRFSANSTDARGFANSLLAHLNDTATSAFQLIFYESEKVKNKYGKWEQKSQNLVSIAPVPLPAAGLMLGAGLMGLFALKRKRRADVAAA